MRLSKEQLAPFIEHFSEEYGVNKNLIFSIIMTESGADPLAIRHEPGWRYVYNADKFAKKARITEATEIVLQSCSLGLMQVMGTVARELGHSENLLMLCYPNTGIQYGTKKLKQLMSKYDNQDDVISAYNMGTPRKNDDGSYMNNAYVMKVNEFLKRGHF